MKRYHKNCNYAYNMFMVYWLFFFLLAVVSPVFSEFPSFLPYEEPENIIVHNRILAKVNGKTISVIDVMKKMDLFLQRFYPDHARSKLARFQYYAKHWQETLSQIIDQELMIADAEQLELKVSDAEVREEILSRFGPNIMGTLDSLGITYDEARLQVTNEMIVHRIMWFRVHAKALNAVNPQDIKEAYQQYCKKNPVLEKWHYQVLSIRSAEKERAEACAKRAFELLEGKKTPLTAVAALLKKEEESIVVSLSETLEGDEKNLSASHKQVLKNLDTDSFSQPIAQVSRADHSVVFRIFFLHAKAKQEPLAFEKMAEKLKEELSQQAIVRETAHYIAKLRDRLGYDEKHMVEMLPPDFHPFSFR